MLRLQDNEMKSDADTASDPNAAPAEQTGEGTENMSEADPEHEESAENGEGGTEKTSTARTIEKIEDHLYALRIGMDEQVSLESILDEIGIGLESVQISTDTAELLVEDGQIRCGGAFEEGSILLTAGDMNVTILCTFDSGNPEGYEEATEQESSADASEETDGTQDPQGEDTDTQETESGHVTYVHTFELLEENRYAVELGLLEGVQIRDIPGLEGAENVTIETDIESLEVSDDSIVCTGAFEEGTVSISSGDLTVMLVCRYVERQDSADPELNADADAALDDAQETVTYIHAFEALDENRYTVELGMLEGVMVREIPGMEDAEDVNVQTEIENLEVHEDSIVCRGPFEEGIVTVSSTKQDIILVCRYAERVENDAETGNTDDTSLDENSGVKLTGDEAYKIQAVMQPENADAVVELVKQTLQNQQGDAEESASEGNDDEEALQHMQTWRVLSLSAGEALEGTVEVSCPMDIVYQELLPEGTELTSVNVQLYRVDLENGEVLPVTDFQIIGDGEQFEHFVFSTDRLGTWALVCTLEYAWIHQYYDMYLDLSCFEADPTMDEDLAGIHVLTETVSMKSSADEQTQESIAETADAEANETVNAEEAENGSSEAEALQENPDTEPSGQTEEGTAVESKVTGISVDLHKLLQALEADPETAELQGIAIRAGGEAQIQLDTDALTVESTEGSVSFENGQIRILGDGVLTIRGNHRTLTVHVSGFAMPETQKTYDFTFAGKDAVPMREIFAQSGLSDHFDPAAFEYELSDPEKVSMILDGENWSLKANDWFENVTLSVHRSWYSASVVLHYPQGMTRAGTVFASRDGSVTMELLEDTMIPQNTALEAAPCEGTDIGETIEEDFASLEYRQNAWLDIHFGDLQEVRAAVTLHGVIDVPENLKPYVSVSQVRVYRMDGKDISVLDASVSGNDVIFETDRLSEFCVVYAFEYDWKVDGQTYAWTLSEDGYVSLGQLAESLGIVTMAAPVESAEEVAESQEKQEIVEATETQEAEESTSDMNSGENAGSDESTENADSSDEDAASAEDTEESRDADSMLSDGMQLFLEHVKHVSWSNPENGWTGTTKEAVPVGDLKEMYGLDCRYPDSMTEEQILELNHRALDADDWALIRLMPFDGEETLTVEMDSGETFSVRISDVKVRQTVLTAGGNTYGITVTCDAASGIPETAELAVREIVEGDPEYPEYYAKATEHVNQPDSTDDNASGETENAAQGARQKIRYARFFDIEIRNNGEKIEPASPVKVQIRLMDAPKDSERAPEVIHFADDGTETMQIAEKTEVVPEVKIEEKPMMLRSRQKLAKAAAAVESTVIEFSADGFSVYSVVYTVDFHWEIDGKIYEFTLPGGGFVSFSQLAEVMGLAGTEKQQAADLNGNTEEVENDAAESDDLNVDESGNASSEQGEAESKRNRVPLTLGDVKVSDETRSFVEDVESISFSTPELVSVSRVENDTTVGAIKESLGLAVQYSAELTEEQIEEINGTKVQAGDWALISMQPFMSEESLTVTMKNGSSFTIWVTDGQIHSYVISDRGDTYKITVTYDDATGIPADARLRVRQLTPDDERYQEDVDRTNTALQARYAEKAGSPLVFEIRIFAGNEEIEPLEGTKVGVEISLVMDGAAEAGSIQIDGVEYILEPAGTDPDAARVVHLTDDGGAEVIEDISSKVDADNNLVLKFETESFSDYTIQGVNNNNGLSGLPDVIYVGDEIYMQNSGNIWVTNIGSVVTENKINNRDDYKSVRAIAPGTFRLCYRNDWNNGNTGYTNQYPGKYITVLAARSEGGYQGTTPPATIPTVSNASIGMTLNLFDYDLDGYLDNRFNNYDYSQNAGSYQNDVLNSFLNHGINNGNALKFWGSGITNGRHGALNNYVEHGVTSIVNNTLDTGKAGGYPVVRNDAGGTGNRNLSYLFTPSDGTDKKAYLNADGLFKKEGDYYVYDSNQNYAWYNPDTKKFEVYNSTYKQKSRSNGGEQATQLTDKAIGFFPFHKWDDQQDLFVNWNKNLNHHFGMSMSVPFSLPKDPKAVVDTNNNPIVFEFSGDDDLWVFIDGRLAMDIGGVHQPTSGTINFQNQTVTVNGNSQSFNFSGLYDGELHTLEVFYIERGGCDSNCMIKFNLTQYGDVEFDKVDEENPSDKLGGAVFGIYKDADCTQPLMENLKNGTSRAFVAESDAHGHVKFSDIPLGDYYLKEIKAPDGYPLDSTVHAVRVYLDENSLVKVKVSIDGIDVVDPGVQIPNKKPDPINLGLAKVWVDQDDNEISAPENTSATFELKRIRNYEKITEETPIEGHGEQTSHLVVGWFHNGTYHVHKEYDLIAGSQATVSWSYVDGYTGSKDCYENGTLIDKNETNVVISEALTMPAAGGTATLYIVDESAHGDAIKNINVAGQQFYGNNGGGVIHKFETITESDPGFQYMGDTNVVNNQVTLPVSGTAVPWEYEFTNLPLAGRTPNTPTTYSYYYYLEEVSSVSPEGTTVIYKDSQGNVLNAADDAETNQTGRQTITNQVDLGALELTKNITITDADDTTSQMTQPNPWVNGTVSFSIDGTTTEGSFTKGIHHDVEITYVAGEITGYKIDTVQTEVNPAVTGNSYSILVNNLVPGDYVIKETGSGSLTLTEITGGKNDADLTEQTITVTVTHGKNNADTLENSAKAAFTNNLKTINVPATKTWADINSGTAHPTIYFRLFYQTEAGDVAVDGVKLKPLPNGTTSVTWQNVPERDQNGQEYVYLVKEYIQKEGGEFTEDGVSYTEAAPNGYVATEEGLSVTNTESDKYDPRTSYTGRKVWVDTANNGATRPENLTVTLMIDRTGDGPSADDIAAVHDGTPYTPVWSRPEGTNEWTYTFNSLPVYDNEWNIIHYYAVETPVDGYEQSAPAVTGTKYVYKNTYNAQHIPNDTNVTISSELHLLPFMAVETKDNSYGKKYHIWTIRTATDAEKAELVRIFNVETHGNNITTENTRFVSGLPVSKLSDGNVEFLYKSKRYKITISKSSGDILKVTVDGSRYMQDMIVGTLEYEYSAGSTDLQNTLKTEEYDVQKTWGNGQTPPEGAQVQFTLSASIPGSVTDENPDPEPVIVRDLTSLGIEKIVVTLNGGQKEGEDYTGDDTVEAPWVYKWENLPQYDKNGSKITYSASETAYIIDGETVDITSDGLLPPTTSDSTYELIVTNRIPTEEVSAQKYWPAGQTVPDGTHIKLAITAKLEDESEPNGVTVTPLEVTLDGKVTAGDESEVETVDTLWQYTWTDLPKYDKDGKRIIYTVAETEYMIGEVSYEELLAAANEPVQEGVDFSFTNELPGTRITVEKIWSNGGGAWPDGVSVIMTLKGSAPIGENGEQTEIETLVIPDIKEGEETVHQTAEYTLSGTEISHTWYNLPMYTTGGKPISYTVDETGMTYTQQDQEPVPIQNWAQAFTVLKEENAENNKVTIDNTPLETEISLTKVWTLNGQPKPMEDGDAIEFKLYRTDEEGELALSADGFTVDKGTPTLNKILYVGGGDNPGWQTVTISRLPKYVLKLELSDDGAIAYYTGVAYYAEETNVTENTRVSYTLSPTNASAVSEGSGQDDGQSSGDGSGEGSGNTEATSSDETTNPTQSAIGSGTITIFNRETDIDITVDKVDANAPDRKLPNAEFQILKWRAAGEGGVYAAYNLETKDFAAEGEDAKSKMTTGQGDDDYGRLVFEGLLDGRYKVVETKTPDGYLKLDISDIFFNIDDGTVTWTDEGGNEIDPADRPNHIDYDELTFTVENTPGSELPNTGGPGTNRLYLIGFLLVLVSGAGLVMTYHNKKTRA